MVISTIISIQRRPLRLLMEFIACVKERQRWASLFETENISSFIQKHFHSDPSLNYPFFPGNVCLSFHHIYWSPEDISVSLKQREKMWLICRQEGSRYEDGGERGGGTASCVFKISSLRQMTQFHTYCPRKSSQFSIMAPTFICQALLNLLE